MDWSNERYVRLYCNDTKSWLKFGWEGQAVLALLVRKVDRSGMLDDVFDADDVALMLGSGFPVAIAEIGLRRLCKKGTAVITENGLLLPNFIEAQETPKSDRRRQRDSREAKRAKASVTKRDILSRAVTQSHGESQSVTLTCADPVLCCADPLPMQNKNKNPQTPKGGSTPSKSKNGYSVEFENFRMDYPGHRHGGKLQDWKSWQIAKKAGLTLEIALLSLAEWKASQTWNDDGGKYIVAFSKFCRDGYWQTKPRDKPASTAPVTKAGKAHQKNMDFLTREIERINAEKNRPGNDSESAEICSFGIPGTDGGKRRND